MKPKILVVEDEITLLETLEYNLTKQDYHVFTASHGAVAINLAREKKPDLIILDVMLPGVDGLEICRTLRREMSAPILMLTARADEVDKIVGLEMGADDYLTKPFSMRELLARVKAQLRRVRIMREEVDESEASRAATVVSPIIEHGNLVINTDRREVLVDGKPRHMKPKEFDLLLFLARNRGTALSRELILERVWGWTNDNSRTVDVHIRWIREKIEPESGVASRIVTVRGIGYRFEG